MEDIDVDKLIQKYEPILLDERHIAVSDMWFYNIAKKVGFDFDNPDREVIRNSNDSVFVYRLGNTPVCIKDYNNLKYYVLCISPHKMFSANTICSDESIPRIVCKLGRTSNNIANDEILFIGLVNELLVISGLTPINPEDYLPDSIDSLIDIINGGA